MACRTVQIRVCSVCSVRSRTGHYWVRVSLGCPEKRNRVSYDFTVQELPLQSLSNPNASYRAGSSTLLWVTWMCRTWTDPNKGINVRNPDKHEPNEGSVRCGAELEQTEQDLENVLFCLFVRLAISGDEQMRWLVRKKEKKFFCRLIVLAIQEIHFEGWRIFSCSEEWLISSVESHLCPN